MINKATKAISDILELVKEEAKRQEGYLMASDAGKYLGRSSSWIKAKIRDNTFRDGVHYYRKEGMIFFRKEMLDEWVQSGCSSTTTEGTNGKHIHGQGSAVCQSLLQRAKASHSFRGI